MYVLKINNKQYKSKQKWSEITIDDSLRLYKLIDSMPEKLKTLYQLLTKEIDETVTKEIDKLNESVTNVEKKRKWPEFYGKVLNVLSNIPMTVIIDIDWTARTEMFYFKHDGVSCETVMIGLLHHPIDYEASGRTYFEFHGEQLLYPESKTVLGEEIPLFNESALTFAESADMELFADEMAGGRYKWATNTISILCRPKGEVYDEAVSLERAEKMGKLTMDVFWDVFFCSIKCFNISNANSLTYLLQLESTRNALLKSPDLVDMGGTGTSYPALLASLTSKLSKKKTSTTS